MPVALSGSGGDFVDLQELAKGWKAAIARARDPGTRHEAQIKNDRGNLPLHSAASFRAPIEVAEALLEAYPEAASITNNYGNLALHFTAWKKGPLEVERLLLKVYPEGAAQKNNHGNLPLHYAAHYNAPLEVVEALYNAYPEGALQKNNDNNTPLDLAIADGASPNVVALLQGQSVPPTDDEILASAQAHCERMEKELQRSMEQHDGMHEDRDIVLGMLLDIWEQQPAALFSAGLNPAQIVDLDSLLDQVRKAHQDEMTHTTFSEEESEAQLIQDSLCPTDDPVEKALSQLVGDDTLKNQIRGYRRTLEIANPNQKIPRHFCITGNPGTGRKMTSKVLADLLYEMGAVKKRNIVECSRGTLVDPKSEAKTVFCVRRILERAAGGVIVWHEPYTLLPSTARPRGRDHGAAALKEMAKALQSDTSPVVILTGAPVDLQRVLVSDIGLKGHFLTRLELPDPSAEDIAFMFLAKLADKGLVPAEGVRVEAIADLLRKNLDPEWMSERNGKISTLLITGVESELRKRAAWDDAASKGSLSPFKLMSPSGAAGSVRMPALAPSEVMVTYEDIQNAIVNGM